MALIRDPSVAPHPPSGAHRTGSQAGHAPATGSGLADRMRHRGGDGGVSHAASAAATSPAVDAEGGGGREVAIAVATPYSTPSGGGGGGDADAFAGDCGPIWEAIRRIRGLATAGR